MRLRPWKLGLPFAAHLAIDALLAHHQDPRRDTRYHTYPLDQMEDTRQRYAP